MAEPATERIERLARLTIREDPDERIQRLATLTQLQGIAVTQGLPPDLPGSPQAPQPQQPAPQQQGPLVQFPPDAIHANSPQFQQILGKALAGGLEGLTDEEGSRLQAAAKAYPDQMGQFLQQLPENQAPDPAIQGLTERLTQYKDAVEGPLDLPGVAIAGAKMGADLLSEVGHLMTGPAERAGRRTPFPLSPYRDLETNPPTEQEIAMDRQFQSLNKAEKALAVSARALSSAVKVAVEFPTQSLDPILNPEKHGTTSGEALQNTAVGLVDMFVQYPDQTAFLLDQTLGRNNPYSKMLEAIGTVLNGGKLLTGADRQKLYEEAVNVMYYEPGVIPLTATIVRHGVARVRGPKKLTFGEEVAEATKQEKVNADLGKKIGQVVKLRTELKTFQRRKLTPEEVARKNEIRAEIKGLEGEIGITGPATAPKTAKISEGKLRSLTDESGAFKTGEARSMLLEQQPDIGAIKIARMKDAEMIDALTQGEGLPKPIKETKGALQEGPTEKVTEKQAKAKAEAKEPKKAPTPGPEEIVSGPGIPEKVRFKPTDIDTGFEGADATRNLGHARSNVLVAKQALELKKITPEQRAQAQADLIKGTKRVTELETEFKATKEKLSEQAPAGSPGAKVPKPPLEAPKVEVKKGVSRSDVVQFFDKEFDVPIRRGHFAEKAEGIFKPKEYVIRTRQANDITVISHEVGHAIEQKALGGLGQRSALKNLSRSVQKELIDAGKNLYGEKKPAQGYRTEGFAEFMREWFVTDDVVRTMPGMTKYFEKTFLKNNPKLANKLKQGQKLIRAEREQGAVNRVFSNIDMTGKKRPGTIKERVVEGARRINTLFADDIAPIEFFEKQVRGVSKLDPAKIDPITSPTMLARYVTQTATGKARQMVLHGTFSFDGTITGKGLREIVQPVSKDVPSALTYSYAKRSIEYWEQGKNPGITLEDAKFTVKELVNPARKKFHEEIVGFQSRVVDYLVDAGGLSREAANAMEALNPAYIPLKRAFEEGSFSGGGKGIADVSSPVKRAKGSGRAIKNPLKSIIENTANIISFADKARVGKAMIELAETTEGAGRWIERIPAPKEATRVSLEAMKKQLEEAGVDLSKANMDEVLTVYSNAGLYKGRDNVVSFWRDGKREFYEVDKRLYGTLKGLDQVILHPVLDFFFGRPTRLIRLGATGLNAGFGLVTNPLRDAFAFSLQTQYSTGSPHLLMKGLLNRIDPKNEMNMLFKRSGADFSQFLGLDRKQLEKAVSEVMASTTKQKALNVVSHPIEAAKDVFSFTESVPRLAEFEAALKKGESLYGEGSASAQIMAKLASADVTVDFSRAGAYGRYINQLVPFWNASIQGLSRFSRFAKDHPFKAAVKGVSYVTIPTIGIWMLNKDEQWYRDMPAWQRYGFWNIEIGKNKDGSPRIVRIPRPFEWGIAYGTGPEVVLDYMYSKDKSIINDGLKYMLEQSLPIGPSHIPTSMKIPVELATNYDFFRDRPIDPFFEVRYKDPEDRFGPYTTETSKFIGKQFGVSPRKLDFLVSSATGGLGKDVVEAGEAAAGIRPEEKTGPANIPVVGRLFQYTETPQRRSERIKFERSQKLNRIRTLLKAGKTEQAEKQQTEWNRRHPDFPISFRGKK